MLLYPSLSVSKKGNKSRVKLKVKPGTGFVVRLLPCCARNVMAPARLAPGRNNVRTRSDSFALQKRVCMYCSTCVGVLNVTRSRPRILLVLVCFLTPWGGVGRGCKQVVFIEQKSGRRNTSVRIQIQQGGCFLSYCVGDVFTRIPKSMRTPFTLKAVIMTNLSFRLSPLLSVCL